MLSIARLNRVYAAWGLRGGVGESIEVTSFQMAGSLCLWHSGNTAPFTRTISAPQQVLL
jgi:hypothetical protein